MKKQTLIKFILACIVIVLLFFRFFRLGSLISPYWEEVAIAYDAYSVLKTAKDHHGNILPIVAFESFGDYKPALYFYSSIPFIKFLSLTVLAVRLPAAIAGLLIIIGNGFLAKNIWQLMKFKSNKQEKRLVFLIASGFTALSPWAFIFSRAAWEVNLATALILWGVNFFFLFLSSKVFKKKLVFILLTVLLFLLSTYTYHGARITAPLLGISLIILFSFQELIIQKTKFNIFFKNNAIFLITALIVGLIGFWPILKNINSPMVKQRAMEASIFYDLDIIEESNFLIEQAGGGRLAKIRYHRFLLFTREVSKNFFSHFNFNYLFVSGDNNPRHSTQAFASFYYLDLLLFLAALIFSIKNFSIQILFLLIYLFLGILPAAFSKDTPHALRTLLALPAFIVFLSFGFMQIKGILSKKYNILFIVFVLFYLRQVVVFYNFYFRKYPQLYQREWQYGYQELMTTINLVDDGEKPIYISREWGRPAMYFWFYSQTEPQVVQSWNSLAKKDQGEYLEFENIRFINDVGEISTQSGIIAASEKTIKQFFEPNQPVAFKLISEISDAQQEIVWQIYEFAF